eukprot:m.208206 g.208206  ORF g.208206 m.208206 type:complete len:87 (+) comp39701_c2_seq1:203-463(+)
MMIHLVTSSLINSVFQRHPLHFVSLTMLSIVAQDKGPPVFLTLLPIHNNNTTQLSTRIPQFTTSYDSYQHSVGILQCSFAKNALYD